MRSFWGEGGNSRRAKNDLIIFERFLITDANIVDGTFFTQQILVAAYLKYQGATPCKNDSDANGENYYK